MNPFDTTYSFEAVVQYGIAIVVFLSMVLAILYAIYGGFLMVLSGGDEGKVKAAVNHIRYAVLGMVVLVIVLLVAPLFFRALGLPYAEYFSPSVIWATIQEISAHIFGTSPDSLYAPGASSGFSSSDPGFTDL